MSSQGLIDAKIELVDVLRSSGVLEVVVGQAARGGIGIQLKQLERVGIDP
jgi:hypothetical protein